MAGAGKRGTGLGGTRLGNAGREGVRLGGAGLGNAGIGGAGLECDAQRRWTGSAGVLSSEALGSNGV